MVCGGAVRWGGVRRWCSNSVVARCGYTGGGVAGGEATDSAKAGAEEMEERVVPGSGPNDFPDSDDDGFGQRWLAARLVSPITGQVQHPLLYHDLLITTHCY